MRHASIITHPSGLFRDPFSLDRFFETALGDRSFPRESAPEWRPAVDVERGEKTLAIRADLPGVDPENIKIAYENGLLTLSGERNDERKAEEDSARRTQIGSGDRSERIRTYNFPQNRVTDHRIKTSYSLEIVLLGDLDGIVEDLKRHDLEEKLAAFGDGAP